MLHLAGRRLAVVGLLLWNLCRSCIFTSAMLSSLGGCGPRCWAAWCKLGVLLQDGCLVPAPSPLGWGGLLWSGGAGAHCGLVFTVSCSHLGFLGSCGFLIPPWVVNLDSGDSGDRWEWGCAHNINHHTPCYCFCLFLYPCLSVLILGFTVVYLALFEWKWI